jgi:thiamine-monophosphate kinase
MTDGPASTVGDAGERALIARLSARLAPPPPWVLVDVGDDAAVLDPGRGQVGVVTTDALVEGVHFRRDWTAPDAIGHKALAVNLSDLAAMGAAPRAALLSLALPADLPLGEFDGLLDGFLALARETGTPLVGGNIARSPGPLVLDVTALGAATRRRVLRRAGGRPGDELYVTGRLGAAAAGLRLREAGRAPAGEAERECLDRYERPMARLRFGVAIGRSGTAAAAVDLSDGLADAARQLAAAGSLGVALDAGRVPIHPGAASASPADDGLQLALAGGEDYELLFAVRARRRSRFLAAARRFQTIGITRVGRLLSETGAWLERDGVREPLPEGFSHFEAGRPAGRPWTRNASDI